MASLNDILNEDAQGKLKKAEFPGFQQPMKASLTEDYFDHPEWIYERKLDGVRALLLKEKGDIKLYSRNQKLITDTYPELEEPAKQLNDNDFIADGEIVAFDANITSFSKLQGRMQVKDREKAKNLKPSVYLYLFDLLYYDGFDLTPLPLRTRKNLLSKLLDTGNRIRYTSHRNEQGKKYHSEACEKGWEGVIAKDASSTYAHSRSKKWLKFKCTAGQELVIGGFTEPQGARKGFGALLVGFYENGNLQYAGKVGTGYNDKFLEKWRKDLDKIEQESSPFSNYRDDRKGRNHWVKPKYVAEIGFTEWTRDNKLRHPRFIGMRQDKDPKKVVKEQN